VRSRLAFALGAGAAGVAGLLLGRGHAARRRWTHPALSGAPLLIAHRGGSGLAPENTMLAFYRAVEDWDADMIELDVHASADGQCMVIHDPTVERTTDGTGAVAELTASELQRLDAAHRFTRDGGATYPFRGRGVTIPTLGEVLEAFPRTRFTVEVKAAAAQVPMLAAIRAAEAEDRVVIAGELEENRGRFAEYAGPVSASSSQIRRYWVLQRAGLAALWTPPADVFQVPERHGSRSVVTPGFVAGLHGHGIAVHVWTVDHTVDMERLLDWGVDGIVTDRPDRLARVLEIRFGRRPAPARVRDGAVGGSDEDEPGPVAGEERAAPLE
jgi:glycerophosphoryl diester phosphodiesterase